MHIAFNNISSSVRVQIEFQMLKRGFQTVVKKIFAKKISRGNYCCERSFIVVFIQGGKWKVMKMQQYQNIDDTSTL